MQQNPWWILKEIKELFLLIRYSQYNWNAITLFVLSIHLLPDLIFKAFSQISLKADERDVFEFFSRAGKVIIFHLLSLLESNLFSSVTLLALVLEYDT